MNNAESTKTAQQVQRARDIAALVKLWQAGMPTVPPPDEKQFELWFQIHGGDFGTLAFGLQECARLYLQRRGVMDYDHCVRHASKVMNRLTRDKTRRGKVEHFPLNILTPKLAAEVGLPPGIALTEQMYWRIQKRALAIQQGRIPAPSPSTAVPASEVKKAA